MFETRLADLHKERDGAAIVRLLDHYSQHAMGSGAPLPPDVRCELLAGLRKHPTTVVFLAEADAVFVGMAVCFAGFSTFKAKPLLNIHDLVVAEGYRGQGIGSGLIDAVVAYARAQKWCAVTLEVRSDNPARKLYASKGFVELSEPQPADATLFGKLLL